MRRSAKEQAGRVLIVVQNLPVPFDRRVWLEATSLAKAGYRVSVICPKAKGFNTSFEILEDVAIYRYPLPIDASSKLGFAAEFLWCLAATTLLSLRVSITGRGFDVLHACNPPETYWLLGYLWRPFGKVFIFDHHDLSPEMYQAKFGGGGRLLRILLWLERRSLRSARVVITTNESHKAVAIARGGKQPDDIYIVRSGPELARFSLYPPDPAWRRGQRHLLVYLGEICKQDGVDHLIRTIKHLVEDYGFTDFHCVLIGGGPHQPAIKAYAAELGVSGFTTFTGRVSDETLCRVLSSADIAIDPDPKNAWTDRSTMNKIVEYMYFGLPIVCYDLTEARVSAGEAARYVVANDEDALARGIVGLAEDDGARQRMGAFGMDRVRNALAWNYSVPPLLAAYDRAMTSARAARRRPLPAAASASTAED
ncbi:MAG TPA: glycosyltransferase family 4 protein [Candidatus Udaeobacter sp.]|nr:glycosyltransferase family 4 protein [Candidatus Udaeobacter sp.]